MAHTKTKIDWTTEDLYWQNEFRNRPYVTGNEYDYWRPAYRYGFEAADRYPDKLWDDVEHDLRTGWDRYEDRDPRSTWEHVKDAVRDAWTKVTG